MCLVVGGIWLSRLSWVLKRKNKMSTKLFHTAHTTWTKPNICTLSGKGLYLHCYLTQTFAIDFYSKTFHDSPKPWSRSGCSFSGYSLCVVRTKIMYLITFFFFFGWTVSLNLETNLTHQTIHFCLFVNSLTAIPQQCFQACFFKAGC